MNTSTVEKIASDLQLMRDLRHCGLTADTLRAAARPIIASYSQLVQPALRVQVEEILRAAL